MDLIQAILAGLVQGTIEWLPLSSQGQVMALLLALGETGSEALKAAVFLHFGTIFAALYYFRKEVKELIQFKDKELGKFLLIALVASGITGIPLYFLLDAFVAGFNPGIILLLIGVLLIAMGLIQLKKKIVKKTTLSNKNAFFLGLAQGFAVLPGISRSGATTSALLFEGFEPEKAFRLSFLLSIPSVLVADILFGLDHGFPSNPEFFIGVIIAAIVGFASISILLRVAKKINFSKFCIGFGLLYAVLAMIYFI